MKIKDCTIGKVVCIKETMDVCNNGKPVVRNRHTKYAYTLIGHIAGFTLNDVCETIVFVNWNDGKNSSIHPELLLECEE